MRRNEVPLGIVYSGVTYVTLCNLRTNLHNLSLCERICDYRRDILQSSQGLWWWRDKQYQCYFIMKNWVSEKINSEICSLLHRCPISFCVLCSVFTLHMLVNTMAAGEPVTLWAKAMNYVSWNAPASAPEKLVHHALRTSWLQTMVIIPLKSFESVVCWIAVTVRRRYYTINFPQNPHPIARQLGASCGARFWFAFYFSNCIVICYIMLYWTAL